MEFTDGQLEFILIQMKLAIKEARELIDKYGYCDEATVGCDDVIELAKSVIDTILDCK